MMMLVFVGEDVFVFVFPFLFIIGDDDFLLLGFFFRVFVAGDNPPPPPTLALLAEFEFANCFRFFKLAARLRAEAEPPPPPADEVEKDCRRRPNNELQEPLRSNKPANCCSAFFINISSLVNFALKIVIAVFSAR